MECTRREWMEKHYPRRVNPKCIGGVYGCPADVPDAPDATWSRCHFRSADCTDNCEDCWGKLTIVPDDPYQIHNLLLHPEDLPEPEEIVEIAIKNTYTGNIRTIRAFYEDGTVHSEDSMFCGADELDEWATYCEETDDYIIPKGWFEFAFFAESFGEVDWPIIAWRKLIPMGVE